MKANKIHLLFTCLFLICFKISAQTNIYVFLVPDCPICKYYIPRLHDLAKKYKDSDCTFHYIIPSMYLSSKEKRNYQKTLRQTFKLRNELIYTDDTDSLGKKFGAIITPEAFVVNANNTVVYSGAIDDKYISITNYKQNTQVFYLDAAIECIVSTKKPELSRVEPVGCIITH